MSDSVASLKANTTAERTEGQSVVELTYSIPAEMLFRSKARRTIEQRTCAMSAKGPNSAAATGAATAAPSVEGAILASRSSAMQRRGIVPRYREEHSFALLVRTERREIAMDSKAVNIARTGAAVCDCGLNEPYVVGTGVSSIRTCRVEAGGPGCNRVRMPALLGAPSPDTQLDDSIIVRLLCSVSLLSISEGRGREYGELRGAKDCAWMAVAV
eukprot:IDg6068t1